MDKISFKHRIKPVTKAEFGRSIQAIDRRGLVDFPWLIRSSKVTNNVYTVSVCDCSALLLTDGEKALLMHLNPDNEENHVFKDIFKYISDHIDLTKKSLQAVLIGSKINNAPSQDIYNNFLSFLTK